MRKVTPIILIIFFLAVCLTFGCKTAGIMDSGVMEDLVNSAFGEGYKYNPGEFMGIKWGSKISDVPGMVLVEENKAHLYSEYKRNDDEFLVAGIFANEIRYLAFQGLLFAGHVEFDFAHAYSSYKLKAEKIENVLLRTHGSNASAVGNLVWKDNFTKITLERKEPRFRYIKYEHTSLLDAYETHANKVDEQERQRLAEEKARAKEEAERQERVKAEQARKELDKQIAQGRENAKHYKGLKVKGLYVGMNANYAITILEDLLNEKIEMGESGGAAIFDAGYLYCDDSGKVTEIYIIDTDTMFNMSGLSTKEFVKKFCKAYGIRMKYYTETGSVFNYEINDFENALCSGYRYKSPEGYEIEIKADELSSMVTSRNLNDLIIRKIAKRREGSFD